MREIHLQFRHFLEEHTQNFPSPCAASALRLWQTLSLDRPRAPPSSNQEGGHVEVFEMGGSTPGGGAHTEQPPRQEPSWFAPVSSSAPSKFCIKAFAIRGDKALGNSAIPSLGKLRAQLLSGCFDGAANEIGESKLSLNCINSEFWAPAILRNGNEIVSFQIKPPQEFGFQCIRIFFKPGDLR